MTRTTTHPYARTRRKAALAQRQEQLKQWQDRNSHLVKTYLGHITDEEKLFAAMQQKVNTAQDDIANLRRKLGLVEEQE